MSDLNVFDRRKLERLFNMGSGYVLKFSDRTYSEFFVDYRVEIDAPRYRTTGDSKAKRMRAFWEIDANHTVGRVLDGLIKFGMEDGGFGDSDPALIDECRKIALRLMSAQPVIEIGAIVPNANGRDFEALAGQVREAIEKNQPETALDRLHTYVVQFVRFICDEHGIEVGRDKPLHSLFGEYVKALREGGSLESAMTERILKSGISVLEAFNDVRNNKSLAHDNPILSYEESLLIFNHITALIRFVKAMERSFKAKNEPGEVRKIGYDDLPF